MQTVSCLRMLLVAIAATLIASPVDAQIVERSNRPRSRDNYEPESSRVRPLSREEFEKATASDLSEDDDGEVAHPSRNAESRNTGRVTVSRSRRISRDNFDPNSSRLRLLTADEFERATLADLAEDSEGEIERSRGADGRDTARRFESDRAGLLPKSSARENLSPRNRSRNREAILELRPLANERRSNVERNGEARRGIAPARERLSRDALESAALLEEPRRGEKQITLKNSFIEKYKNRACISTDFTVVHAGKVHAASKDGDQHVAGLAEDVGLACVAEIMNATDEPDAVELMWDLEEAGIPEKMTGAWRLWCEHPGKYPHIQDDLIPEYKHSNPDHVFEIHPVSRLANISLLDTFRPIEGYEPYDAKKAFTYYQSVRCRIVPDPATQTTTIYTPQAKYNYANFKIRLIDEEQFITPDGRIVRCDVLDEHGDEVAANRRMIFVKNTPPETAVRGLQRGDEMDVLGIPRIDLALVSWRVRNAEARPDALTWNLPYEMIIAGHYNEN